MVGDAQLVDEMQSLLRLGAQQEELRHKYLDVVPWSIVNADTQEGATAFLKSIDSKPLEELDELTREIVEHLRADVEAMAEQGVLSDRLSDCISEYGETPLDESAGEGYHRSTHHVFRRASGSSDPDATFAVNLKGVGSRFWREHGLNASQGLRTVLGRVTEVGGLAQLCLSIPHAGNTLARYIVEGLQ